MTAILFFGALMILAIQYVLGQRVKALEAEIARLREGVPPPEQQTDWQGLAARAAKSPARVVRTSPEAIDNPLARVKAIEESRREEAPDEIASPPPGSLGNSFEKLVGGRLLIWIGGIALAVAGIFLVRYSIEIGLITPPVRMVMAMVFGLVLLAAGEFARSRPDGLIDPRAGQALVGAGILVLYATAYGSYTLYALISLGTASGLMVAITAAALVLSLRHGAPTAAMGLAGGFATPLLVGDPDAGAVPLLAYLGLLDIALFTIAGRRGWTWLAAAAVVLSFVWTGSLLFAPRPDALAAGLFIVMLGVAGSTVRAGPGRQLDFIRPAGIGMLQLAGLVARTDLGWPAWALFGALSLATFPLAARRPETRFLPALALAFALALLAMKAAGAPDAALPFVAAGITLLFAAGALPGVLRGRDALLATQVAAVAFAAPAVILRLARPELLGRPAWGGLFILLSAGPAFLAWARRAAVRDGEADLALFAAAAAAMLLLGIAAFDLLPRELVGSAWLAIALGGALAGRRMPDLGLTALCLLAAALAGLWSMAMVPQLWGTLLGSLVGEPALASHLPGMALAFKALVLPVPLLLALWHFLPGHFPRLRLALPTLAGAFLVAALYILFKQMFGLAGSEDFVARGFAERMIFTQALFVLGWAICTGRLPIRGLDSDQRRRAGLLLTALAAARLVWFDMLIHNPLVMAQWVGALPVLNLLAPAYLLSAFWLYRARRGAAGRPRSGLWLAFALASLLLGVMLMVRQLFQGGLLDGPGIPSSESYGYSLAGLLLSIALLLSGIRLPDKALRLAGLALLTATTIKVFLVDAGALEGVLRILSFLVLGIALIGIGKLYTKVLDAESRPPPSPEAA